MCFKCDECAEFIPTKTVKCRKAHRCSGCQKTIQRGEMAKYSEWLCDEFSSMYECEQCQRAILSIAAEERRNNEQQPPPATS